MIKENNNDAKKNLNLIANKPFIIKSLFFYLFQAYTHTNKITKLKNLTFIKITNINNNNSNIFKFYYNHINDFNF